MTIDHGRFSYTAVVLSFLTFLQLSCKEESTVSPVFAPMLAVRGIERAGARFSADVEIITGLVTGRWADWPGAVSRIRYRLDQLKTSAGWRTSYSSIRTAEPDGKSREHPARLPALARVDVDEAGAIAMYDESGKRVKLDNQISPSARIALSTTGKNKGDQLRDQLARMEAPQGPPETRRSGLVVDRAAQQAIIADLSSKGRFVRQDGSRKHYQLALEKGELEIAIDSAIGAIVEINSAPGDAPPTRATYEYTTTPGGQLVRTLLRTERQSTGSAPSFVSETRVSNITLDEGGAP